MEARAFSCPWDDGKTTLPNAADIVMADFGIPMVVD
jgi:hypothetical protein